MVDRVARCAKAAREFELAHPLDLQILPCLTVRVMSVALVPV